jgi:hypothetical protein
MVCPGMVFTLVISKIFLARMPSDIICILRNLITNPEVLHLHRTGALRFNGVVRNANSGDVVAMDRSFMLWMSQLFESQPENHAFFTIQEEGTEFGFCSGRNNKTEDCAQSKKCTIQFDGVAIFRRPSHKEMIASPTLCIRF